MSVKYIEEKDRWSVHLEFFKIAIALPTAVLAAAGAIFTDESKIPADGSRFILLFALASFVFALSFAAFGLGALASHVLKFNELASLLTPPPADDTIPVLGSPAPHNSHRYNVVWFANASLCCLALGGISLGVFFAARTSGVGGQSFERAVAMSLRGLMLDPVKNESAALKSIELQGDRYTIDFVMTPGGGVATVTTDASGTHLISAKRP